MRGYKTGPGFTLAFLASLTLLLPPSYGAEGTNQLAAAPETAPQIIKGAAEQEVVRKDAALEGQKEATAAATAPLPGQTDATTTTAATATTAATTALQGQIESTAAQSDATVVDGPIVIDNDEVVLQEEWSWKEIEDTPGKTKISAGARFPVAIMSALTSNTAKLGDPIEGRTKIDIKIGGRMIAPKGTRVIGHVSKVYKARKMLHAEFSPKRWMRAAGALGVQFDEIITDKGEHLPLVAVPARQPRIINNVNEGRVLGVNHNGEIASPLSTQVKHQALHLAIRAGASAGGVFSFGAVPAAYAVMGAISPSFAFMQPVGKNVRHRRLKGFGMGLLAGLPGGFLISDSIIRGPEAKIMPGDIFEAELKQDFTGEAATDAQLMPGASTKVRGEVLPEEKKK